MTDVVDNKNLSAMSLKCARRRPELFIAGAGAAIASLILLWGAANRNVTSSQSNFDITRLDITCQAPGEFPDYSLSLSDDIPYNKLDHNLRNVIDPLMVQIIKHELGDAMTAECGKRPSNIVVTANITEALPKAKRARAGTLIKRLVDDLYQRPYL